MVEGSRTIQSGLPWHGSCLSQFQESVDPYFDEFEQRPPLFSFALESALQDNRNYRGKGTYHGTQKG
jgi:hypothetical protein